MSTLNGSASSARREVDLAIYGMDAVLKSSYRFTGRSFVELKTLNERTVEVHIRPKSSEGDAEAIMGEFLNDLIDQRLRSIVASETAGVRDRIMAHALSQTDFVRPDLETADPRLDPLCISRPDKARTTA